MRNKGFFWFLTIILALACLYQLSFTFITSSVEKKAVSIAQQKVDSVVNSFGENSDSLVLIGSDSVKINNDKAKEKLYNFYRDQYLRTQAGEEVYPLFGHTYEYCKQHELNFGLDLRGGMSVTLEISTVDLVYSLAGEPQDPKFLVPFNEAKKEFESKGGDFFSIFIDKFEEHNKDNDKVTVARYFHAANNDKFDGEASNDQIASIIKEEARSALDGVEDIIEKRVNQFGVAQPNIQKLEGSSRLYIELPGVKDKESVRKKLQSTANLEFYEAYQNGPNEFGSPQIGPMLFNQVGPALAKSMNDEVEDESEETETPLLQQDSTSIEEEEETLLVEEETSENQDTSSVEQDFFADDEGVDTTDEVISVDEAVEDTSNVDPASQNAFVGLLQARADQQNGWYPGPVVGLAAVNDTGKISSLLKSTVATDILPEDLRFMWGAKQITDDEGKPTGAIYLYALKIPEDGPEVSGEDIYSAKQDFNQQTYEVVVSMQMTSEGTDRWADMTTRLNQQYIAITMDNVVFSAPNVNEPMTNGTSQISGNFTVEEAEDLAGLLNAGALPAPAKIVEETIVGPSLGAENIRSGLISFAIALIVVLIYMAFYYSKAGLVSNVALIANIFFLLGSLASMGAILTLPGIAGIVLTLGMAVDANVLIFERVREEVAAGKGQKLAIKDGFNKALSSILDANITTLLTAVVLAIFGSGPIKGFAVTLIIGIFTSLFSAIIITRLIITQWMSANRTVTFSTKITEKWFTTVNLPFIAKRKLFYVISAVVVIGGAISLMTKGLDYSVEFTGGRTYTVVFENEPDFADIKSSLADQFVEEDGTKNTPEVKMVSDKFTAMITTNYMINSTSPTADATVDSLLTAGLEPFGDFEIENSRKVSDSISADLKESALWSVVFALIIIFLYILLRFRKWQYGLGALLAMGHDVLIVLGLFSIFYGILPFSMEMDQAFIAAILTVVGYSINDTVVVFDRIREYLGIYRKKSSDEVVNMALNSTLSRTVNTSVSTFLVLLMIFIFGGESIRGFTFALMIGVIVGTYSSVCVATPSMFDMSSALTDADKKKE